jgi:C-8 sterol isomerase
MMRTLLSLAVGLFALLSGIFIYIDAYHLDKFYIFDPKELHDLSLRAIAASSNDTASTIAYIISDLTQKPYSKHINTEQEWIFNNAGGAMGAMYIIHASITEYLIIFGTAIGTEGHTGRHTVDDYFNILHGTQLAFKAGEFEPETYPQGSVHWLRRGEVKQYKMESACFAMEYARGWIPPMVGFGFADGLTSTLDWITLWRTIVVTAREMIGNLILGKF